jgi:CubicO group peptidase (beta-lactamase class C family)
MIDVTALRALIDSERIRFEVPGAAVVVVANNEVVLSEGFGVADLASGRAMTNRTMFPIASNTKCFTAAMLCVLAEQGKVDLDAPVRDVIPWFKLHDSIATELVSCRDLLAHRTGLPAHDMMWYGEIPLSLEEVTRRLRYLPTARQPRQRWQYNNMCYMVAGYVTEVLTGQTWTDAVQSVLLDPLGMSDVRFSVHDLPAETYSLPYREVGGEMVLQVLPSRALQAPPGGIVAHVDDLARWVLARLGNPTADGGHVLSDSVLRELHAPAMIEPKLVTFDERQSCGYALGCSVDSYRGHTLIDHGGSLIGYSSEVAIVPNLGAAVAVVANRHYSELPQSLVASIVDRIAGLEPIDWGERFLTAERAIKQGRRDTAAAAESRADRRPPSRPIDEFVGIYSHPAYGDIEIVAAPGSDELLDAEYHGLGERAGIVHRDRDSFSLELREFEAQVPLIFTINDGDEIAGLTLPLETTVEAIAFVKRVAPVTPGLLAVAAGKYALGPFEITVSVVDDVITVEAPSVGVVQLVSRGGSVFGGVGMPQLRIEFDGDTVNVRPLGVFSRVEK